MGFLIPNSHKTREEAKQQMDKFPQGLYEVMHVNEVAVMEVIE